MSKKELIQQKAMDLFIERGFHGTSTKMISDETGVSNGAIFHHFETKECIARAIYLDIKEKISQHLKENLPADGCFRNLMDAYWHNIIEWSLKNPKEKEFLSIFSNTPMIKCCITDKKRLYGFIIDRIKQAIEQKEVVIDDIEYYMVNFAAVTDGVIKYINFRPEKNTPEFLDKTFSLYWRSIVNF